MRSTISTAGRRAVAVACLVVLVLPTACAPTAEETSAVTGAPPSAPEGAGADEAAALDAYTGMWEAVVTASHGGADGSEDLRRHAVGGALELMTEALEGAREAGTDVSGEPALDPSVRIESSDSAQVTDCLDDSSWRLTAGPAPSGTGPRRVDAGLVHDGLAWRVSDLRIWEPGTC